MLIVFQRVLSAFNRVSYSTTLLIRTIAGSIVHQQYVELAKYENHVEQLIVCKIVLYVIPMNICQYCSIT